MPAPDLTVSIATANHRDVLRECLASLFASTSVASLEVYVIDSGAGDGTPEMLAKDFPSVHLIRNPAFRGYAAANNQALRRATGRYAAILNDDTVIRGGAFDRIVAFMDTHPEAGAVGPYLENRDGTHQRSSYVGYPTLATDCYTRALPLSWLWRRRMRRLPTYADGVDPFGTYNGDPIHVRRVSHLMGACIVVRRDVLEKVGLLDERFYLSYEDQDWCKRVAAAGWQVVYYPDSKVVHLGSQSTRALAGFSRVLVESRREFQRKHGSALSALLVKPLFAAIAVNNRIWSAAARPLRAVLARRGASEHAPGAAP